MDIGLSILIPIYHWNPNDFVRELNRQAESLNIDFEILVYDDCSMRLIDMNLSDLAGVTYKKLDKNIGRSAIRNLMATQAKYDKLLFLDGDSYPKFDNFLKNYLENDLVENTIICGGTAYENLKEGEKPTLRWTYGKEREESETNKKGFASNNFLMFRSDFLDLKFNERIKGYGHEDTLFGISFKEQGGKIEQCNSPLYHLGLESDDAFLAKTKEGAKNLRRLYELKLITAKDNKLIRFHDKLKFRKLIYLLIYVFVPVLLSQVKKRHNLKAFDILKWYWFNQSWKIN